MGGHSGSPKVKKEFTKKSELKSTNNLCLPVLLIGILLIIGGIGQNPGPSNASSDAVSNKKEINNSSEPELLNTENFKKLFEDMLRTEIPVLIQPLTP